MKKLNKEAILLSCLLLLPTFITSPFLFSQDVRNSHWGDSYVAVIEKEGVPTIEDEKQISERMFNNLKNISQGNYFILYKKEFGGQETNIIFAFDNVKGKLVSVGYQIDGDSFELYRQVLLSKYGEISGYSEESYSWLSESNVKIILYKSIYFPEYCYLTLTNNDYIIKEKKKLFEEKLKGL